MSGEGAARAALALDAIYCMTMGLPLVVFRARLGGLLRCRRLRLRASAAAFHPARGSRALLVFSAIEVATLAVAQALSLARRGEHS